MPNVERTEEEWRELLTPQQYEVTRRKGTERAFAGAYVDAKEPGTYRCVCCGEALFRSETKFDSGSGWPSFTDAMDPSKVRLAEDTSHGMHRVEVMCRNCNAHLGHVFPDGPGPGGQRYCVNSCSLTLEKDGTE